MRRKKHTNSCLLHLLGLLAGSGFILLCVAFGLYFLTEKPSIYEQDDRVMNPPLSLEQEVSSMGEGLEEAKRSSNEVADITDESIEASVRVPEEKIEESPLGDSVEVVQDDIAPDVSADTSDESGIEPSAEIGEESLEFEEVTVYDSYVLQLDEDVLDQIGHTLKNGQIDYAAVISEMFSSLSFSEQVKLLNMILSKVQNININEIWNMISDGVSKEDSAKLQQLVQEHFTLEELDELYSYYASLDIVENE